MATLNWPDLTLPPINLHIMPNYICPYCRVKAFDLDQEPEPHQHGLAKVKQQVLPDIKTSLSKSMAERGFVNYDREDV